MSDTAPEVVEFVEPESAPPGATYEVYEYLAGQFTYTIFEPGAHDGTVDRVLWHHQSGAYVAEAADGEPTLYHRDGRKMPHSFFKTEAEAHAYCRAKGAVCRTTYGEPHPDPKIQAYLDADSAIWAAFAPEA